MRPFRYRLQPALDRAVLVEREAATELGRVQAELAGELKAIAAIDARADEARLQLSEQIAAAASAFAAFDRQLVHCAAQHAAGAERIAVCRTNVARARAELAHRAQRRAALERHRERQRVQYAAVIEVQEQAEIDETNLRCASAGAERTVLA